MIARWGAAIADAHRDCAGAALADACRDRAGATMVDAHRDRAGAATTATDSVWCIVALPCGANEGKKPCARGMMAAREVR